MRSRWFKLLASFYVAWSVFAVVYSVVIGNWWMVLVHVAILVMWVFILKPDRTLYAYWDWRYRTSTRFADKMDRKYWKHNYWSKYWDHNYWKGN